MISCSDSYSCLQTMIEAGSGVSTLIFEALANNASRYVDIVANGTSRVEISCKGSNSCDHMTLKVNNAKKVTMTANTSYVSGSIYGFVGGNMTINNTEEVSLSCKTANACFEHSWILSGNKNVTVECNGENACNYNKIYVNQSEQVTIEAITDLPSITQNTILLESINSLTLTSPDGGIQNGIIWLRSIENFLLSIGGSGGALGTAWDAQNISNVTINNWNATSFWLVRGMPILNRYQCPDDKDCYIRVDSTFDQDQIQVACPIGNDSTCVFYCTAVETGCGSVALSAVGTPKVGLYFNVAYNPGFSVVASASYSTSEQKSINISCNNPHSCANSTFFIAGYSNTTLVCEQYFSCEYSLFTITDFSVIAMVMSNAQGLYEATLMFSYGLFVYATSEDTTNVGQAFRQSHWSFYDIDHVHVYCGHESDCEGADFDSTQVTETLVLCGSSRLLNGDSCLRTTFNNYENSSFYLNCLGGDYSCRDVLVQYDGNAVYDTSCVVVCKLNQQNETYPNCDNMTILVKNNEVGFDAISFSCEISNGYQACQDVNIQCGDQDGTCTCPVFYDTATGAWNCDGQCGTATCESSSTSLSSGAVAAIVLSVLVVVGVSLYVIYQCYKKRQVESQLFEPLGQSKSNKHLQTTATDSGGYQNL